MGVSNQNIMGKNRTGSQIKWARKRKALLEEAEGLAGAEPSESSSGGSAVTVSK
jgi:hypothetical protein